MPILGFSGGIVGQSDIFVAEYSRVTKVLAPWVNLIVQLASSQPPLMVPKTEMLSQETEPSNFYSSPLIEAEEDIQSGKLGAFLSYHSV